MSTCVVWFRNDLRLRDNEVLNKAVADYETVLPVYIFDIEYLSRSSFGSRKMGARRLKFILESLQNLNKGLKERGSKLLILTGRPKELLPDLVKAYQAKAVIANKEIASEEVAAETEVADVLYGIAKLQLIWGSTLFHNEDLPMSTNQLPDIFTEFRKRTERYVNIRPEFNTPSRIPFPAKETRFELQFEILPSLSDLGFQEIVDADQYSIAFLGGEDHSWKRLNQYFYDSHCLADYKETRNGLLGLNYSSKFSPWLAQGCISAKSIYFEIRRFEKEVTKNDSTYWLIFELIWRDYFRFVLLKYGNKLFRIGGIHNKVPEIDPNIELMTAWKDGNTGIPFIDANMRELRATGFMSNRGRQNVASFLVNDLKQDWREGAAWFEQELIDYDVASNWGNWAYIAGVGNDPRNDRYFNIMLQTERYDSLGLYVKHWLPELQELPGDVVHKPWILSRETLNKYHLANTPFAKPLVVPERWGL